MIVDGIVEPGGHLDPGKLGRGDRRVGEAHSRVQRWEGPCAHVVAVVEDRAACVAVREVRFAPVEIFVLLILENVRRVVQNDVEEDLDAAVVGLGDQGLQFGVGAEVRVELGEVGDPIAVVAGGDVRRRALHGPVLEHGRHPNGSYAQVVQVLQLAEEAGDVAAVIEALVGGVEAGHQPVAHQAASVVGGAAVVKAIRHDEVEDVVLDWVAHRRLHERGRFHREHLLHRDVQQVGVRVVGEGHLVAHVVHGEAVIRAARHTTDAVVLGPTLVDGHLALVVARREDRGGKAVDAVVVGVLEPGAQAVRLPVAGAAQEAPAKLPGTVAITSLKLSVTHLLCSSK